MARIKFGSIVTEIHGKIGGTIFQSNKHGFSAKNTNNISRSLSGSQINSQQALLKAVKLWYTFQPDQQLAWNNYAATYPQPCKHNPSSFLTGYELFVKYHSTVFQFADAVLTYPVTTPRTPPVPSPTLVVGDLSFTLFPNWDVISNYFYCNVAISYPVKSSVNFVGCKPRVLINYYSDVEQFNLYDLYLAKFGIIPNVGDYCFVSIQIYGTDTPIMPAPSKFKLIVTAP